MMRNRVVVPITAAVLTAAAGPCGSVFQRPTPVVERRNATISPATFRVVGAVASSGSRTDLALSATIRQQLSDSGIAALKVPGRWETQPLAVSRICAPGSVPAVNGVLFVWYNRLELFDCATESAAYEISGGSELGINQMAERLVAYLKRGS